MTPDKGTQRGKYPLRVADMVKECRRLAADHRREAAAEMGPIILQSTGGRQQSISRLAAAASLDRQADRWQAELDTGIPNRHDRDLIGE